MQYFQEIPDFVNSEVGILIQGENVQALEKAISGILEGEQKFDSKYLAQYAKNNYVQDLLIDKLINVYKENLK